MDPRMERWAIHGALWWFIDSKSAICCFQSYQTSCEPTTKKTTTAECPVQNILVRSV